VQLSPVSRRQPSRTPYPLVSVIVPTRNEAKNLEIVLPAIAAVRPAVHEIIVVDGHSTDGSIDVALRVLPSVKAITQTRKGKGNAMACGFAAATGDVVVMFDADGSADPAEIPAFVDALIAGADFAKGSRFAPGGGSDDITLLRRSGNAGLNGVANTLFGTAYSDLCYGYNAFWADLLPVLDLPPIDAPHPRRGCCGATASRSRRCSTAAWRRRVCGSRRCRPSSGSACSARPTSGPSPTARACSVL